ncbi:MAG: hypothetical protein GPOALKHO_001075 [Sodalis sp.]|nr:MAG: hypothetical protein GPOALKHO_001075 [Sodalis sp.]
MLGYFSTLWSSQPNDLVSDLTHALYLLLFMIMYRSMVQGHRRRAMGRGHRNHSAGSAGFLTVNTQPTPSNRLTDGFSAHRLTLSIWRAISVLGIFMCLIIMRNTGAR